MQLSGISFRSVGLGNYTPDPADLIPDASGLFYDTFGGGTWFYNEMSGQYEMAASVSQIAPVAANTPPPVAVTSQTVAAPVSGQVMTTTGQPVAVVNQNPGVRPTAGGAVTAVPQAPASAAIGQWSNSFTVWPTIQRQLGLNNLAFVIAGGMVGIALVLTVGGGGYAGYRYGRRGDY